MRPARRSFDALSRVLAPIACCVCWATATLSAQDQQQAQDRTQADHEAAPDTYTSTLLAPEVIPPDQQPTVLRSLELAPVPGIGGTHWRITANTVGGRCCLTDMLWFWESVGMSAKGPSSFRSTLEIGNPRTALTVGMVGRRDYRLPLFMSSVFGNVDVPSPQLMSVTDMSAGQVAWQAVGSVRHQLFMMKRGATIGIVGDAVLPAGRQTHPTVPNEFAIRGRAVRFGVTLGF